MHPDKAPKLLYELIKNSRRSDRDLAKVLGFSQPTVTRTRSKLEEEKYVLQYTALPDFTKLGFELIAFTFAQLVPEEAKRDEQLPNQLEKDPRVVFIADGDGLDGKNFIVASMHKNYTDYSNFVSDFRKKAKTAPTNSFIVTLTGIRKHLSLNGLQRA